MPIHEPCLHASHGHLARRRRCRILVCQSCCEGRQFELSYQPKLKQFCMTLGTWVIDEPTHKLYQAARGD